MEEDSLARVFNTLPMRYSQYINDRRNARGRLWQGGQGRFFSCVLDERHLYAGVKYVENNPVRAGIARKADAYCWSSARAHVRKIADPVLLGDCYLEKKIKGGSECLSSFEDKFLMDAIRTNTKTGRPCGENSFIAAIENLLGRGLAAQPRGRPKN